MVAKSLCVLTHVPGTLLYKGSMQGSDRGAGRTGKFCLTVQRMRTVYNVEGYLGQEGKGSQGQRKLLEREALKTDFP